MKKREGRKDRGEEEREEGGKLNETFSVAKTVECELELQMETQDGKKSLLLFNLAPLQTDTALSPAAPLTRLPAATGNHRARAGIQGRGHSCRTFQGRLVCSAGNGHISRTWHPPRGSKDRKLKSKEFRGNAGWLSHGQWYSALPHQGCRRNPRRNQSQRGKNVRCAILNSFAEMVDSFQNTHALRPFSYFPTARVKTRTCGSPGALGTSNASVDARGQAPSAAGEQFAWNFCRMQLTEKGPDLFYRTDTSTLRLFSVGLTRRSATLRVKYAAGSQLD